MCVSTAMVHGAWIPKSLRELSWDGGESGEGDAELAGDVEEEI